MEKDTFADLGFVSWFCMFSAWLNQQGFSISISQMQSLIQVLAFQQQGGMEIFDDYGRVLLCSTPEQVQRFSELRKMFEDWLFYQNDSFSWLEDQKAKEESYQSNRTKLIQESEQEMEIYRQQWKRAQMESIGLDRPLEELANEVAAQMMAGNLEKAMKLQALLEKALRLKEEPDEDDLKAIKEKYNSRIQSLDNKHQEDKKLTEEIQKQINKIQSLHNRNRFDSSSAHNPTYSLLPSDTQALFDKKLSSLSSKEIEKMLQALRQNASKFFTKLSRRISTSNKRDLDMANTIKMACRSKGIPFILKYKRPKKSKAKLVMLLDVSGSCAQASKTMLAFIHVVSKVFPRGVHAFGFVNRIYDITDSLKAKDTIQVIDKVLKTIPTRGVYSDYQTPINQLWKEQRNLFTKQTTFLIIGDARGNGLGSGEQTFRKMRQAVANIYWLNTEKEGQWNSGDSMAGIYQKYCKMTPVESAGDILEFIENLRMVAYEH